MTPAQITALIRAHNRHHAAKPDREDVGGGDFQISDRQAFAFLTGGR